MRVEQADVGQESEEVFGDLLVEDQPEDVCLRDETVGQGRL
ncbi:hypothetical protein [Gordonia sp. (in: high G+C Gram-positive bacteria)]